jgi:hydrogenase maturation protein HypF
MQIVRLKVLIGGAVQGVGFRPFVFRLAQEFGLKGWVNNNSQGVWIEVEGARDVLNAFLLRLETEKPPHAFITSLEHTWLDPVGHKTFEIRPSGEGEKTALVLPDIATCKDCLSDILDKTNRRYRYPFTNCTHCGPRYSIIEALPYDRIHTSMKGFHLCPDCQKEYEDPANRRFHAQPNACPVCGPQLEAWDSHGKLLASKDEALKATIAALRMGQIVALKGLGGFQLLVDACNEEAVQKLRQRKHREEKPFALMFPSLDALRAVCEVSALEERLLKSPEAPIVLLQIMGEGLHSSIAAGVAPNNPFLGAMLPYTPLHHLLMADLGGPLVATSGNLSDEPICIDEHEALERLGGIADFFLVHNRPIVRQVDDSVARIMVGRELVLRRARGFAPLPVMVRRLLPPMLAVGGQLKNTIAISNGKAIFVSQHIGDLETAAAFEAFQTTIQSLEGLYGHRPETIVCDAHPDYLSTQFARKSGLPVIAVQHHHAHVAACMAENDLEPPVLGVSWDGTGYGLDGTIWGGEFLSVMGVSFRRLATFRPFRLPGGEKAIREPRRTALGLLYEMFGPGLFSMRHLAPVASFSAAELRILSVMLEKDLNSPVTSSVGRLFDAVGSMVGLGQETRYEGQSAQRLEWALRGVNTEASYPLQLNRQTAPPDIAPPPASTSHGAAGNPQASIIVDWEPLIWAILEDMRRRLPVGLIAAKFHNSLVETVIGVARLIGQERVVLTGGCFQNRYLTERAVERLVREGFRPYWHQRIPPNDGGIALGQLAAAAWSQPGLRREPGRDKPAALSNQ